MIESLLYPSLNSASEFINTSLRIKKFILCCGLFSVEYVGRSSSTLGLGERVLIIKGDGSVLVHRSKGYEPINWQPSGCIIRCEVEDDKMIVFSERRRPKEFLKAVFDKVYIVFSTSLIDNAKFLMGPSEEKFYSILFKHPEFIEKGLRLTSKQKSLSAGVVDFTGVDGNGNYVFVEVKRRTAGVDAVKQLDKYIRSQPTKFRGILCAPSITKPALSLLEKKGYTFRKLDLNRISKLLTIEPFEETLDKHL
ncbi:MAG: endonuclease NucS [Nitrososphaeria archaeon]|nr:endonuclease NucS [Nitrososphaeria archaeon]